MDGIVGKRYQTYNSLLPCQEIDISCHKLSQNGDFVSKYPSSAAAILKLVFGTTWLRFSSRSRFRARVRNLVGPGPDECHMNRWTSQLRSSGKWLGDRLGALRQQAITWANVDQISGVATWFYVHVVSSGSGSNRHAFAQYCSNSVADALELKTQQPARTYEIFSSGQVIQSCHGSCMVIWYIEKGGGDG